LGAVGVDDAGTADIYLLQIVAPDGKASGRHNKAKNAQPRD
jgi:hypothetical protein